MASAFINHEEYPGVDEDVGRFDVAVQQAALVGVSRASATAELKTSPPGLSAKDLDDYSTRLGAELGSRAS